MLANLTGPHSAAGALALTAGAGHRRAPRRACRCRRAAGGTLAGGKARHLPAPAGRDMGNAPAEKHDAKPQPAPACSRPSASNRRLMRLIAGAAAIKSVWRQP